MPRLVLMFGIPGSGKNWVLDKRQKKNHVVIPIVKSNDAVKRIKKESILKGN